MLLAFFGFVGGPFCSSITHLGCEESICGFWRFQSQQEGRWKPVVDGEVDSQFTCGRVGADRRRKKSLRSTLAATPVERGDREAELSPELLQIRLMPV